MFILHRWFRGISLLFSKNDSLIHILFSISTLESNILKPLFFHVAHVMYYFAAQRFSVILFLAYSLNKNLNTLSKKKIILIWNNYWIHRYRTSHWHRSRPKIITHAISILLRYACYVYNINPNINYNFYAFSLHISILRYENQIHVYFKENYAY